MQNYLQDFKKFYENKIKIHFCEKCSGKLEYLVTSDKLITKCENCGILFSLKTKQHFDVKKIKNDLQNIQKYNYNDTNTIRKMNKLLTMSEKQYLKNSAAKDKYKILQEYHDEKLRIKTRQSQILSKMKISGIYDETDIENYIVLNNELNSFAETVNELFSKNVDSFVSI